MGQGSRRETTGESAPTPVELDAVAAAVEEALDGVTILDRGLELDEGARADLAGVDAAGRLVLVHLAGAESDRAALAVLDLLVCVGAQADLIARHLASPRISTRLEPRVVVVLDASDRRLAARIAPITGIETLELRTVRSLGGERSYLVPGRPEATLQAEADSLHHFLDALPPERETLGRDLCERLARLDDDLRTEVSAEAVAWFFQDRPLVRLESRGGKLRGAVGPRGPVRELERSRDADQLLEETLARLVEDLGRGRREGGQEAAAADELVAEVGLALLTPEEIQAFRD